MNEERFAEELDRIVSGQPPEESDALAAFARDVQMHQGAARLDPDRRAEIRRNLMQHATTLNKQTTGGPGPLSQPALTNPATYNPWVRRRPAASRTPSGWRGHMVTAQSAIAIMTVFALLIVGSAWYTNQQGGDGGPGPSATRYAAAPTEAAVMTGGDGNNSVTLGQDGPGTPASGVIEDDIGWTTFTSPEECVPHEDYSDEDIARITAAPQDWREREYGPFRASSQEQKNKAISMLRSFVGCQITEEDGDATFFRSFYFSERWIYNQFSDDPAAIPWNHPDNVALGRSISGAYNDRDPSDFVILVSEEELAGSPVPPLDGSASSARMAFRPQHVIQLMDGRLAVPMSMMYTETDQFEDGLDPQSTASWFSMIYILAESAGMLQIDEVLPFCVGDCEQYWAEQEALYASSEESGTPEGTATPPMIQGDGWTEPITADQCIPREPRTSAERQEITTGTPEFTGRAYGPADTPSVRDAADVAMTLRRYQACLMADTNADGYVSERFIHESSALAPDAPAWTDEAKIRAGQEVSGLYQDVGPAEFVILTDEPEGTPPTSMRIVESPGVYEPRHARQMADGRIALPATQLDPGGMFPQDRSTHIGNVYLLSESDSVWVVDEMLLFCIGDCDEFWAAMEGSANQPATPIPAMPIEESTRLSQMLSVLPAPLAIAEDGVLPGWAYADIEQRFEDLGLTDEMLAEDPLLPMASNAYGPMAHTTSLFDYAADEEFAEAIGFNPLEVDQVLVTGRAPDVLTLLRGNWDEETLTAAWEAAGYTEIVTETGHTIWSLDPDGWVDPQHPIQRRMFQQLNNVAILDGGILAYAGFSVTIEMVIQTQSGEMASAVDDPWLQPLFTAVSGETISGIGFTQPGSTLYDLGEIAANPNLTPDDREVIEDQLRASREAVGPMPEYRGAIFAVEGDPTGEGAIVVQIRAFSDEEAEQIVRVVEWRWQNLTSQRYQRTFDSIMPLIDATTDGDVVTLRFDPQGAPRMWLELLQGGDLLVFAVDAGLPTATPEAPPATPMAIAEEDAAWWTWPNADECRPDEFPGDTLEPGDYPERAYLPLGTPDREDAEAAARVARTAMACEVHYSTPPFASSRYRAESDTLGEDPYEYGQTLLEQNENGRAIAESFPITEPTEFGRLRTDQPSQESPPSIGPGLGAYAANRYEPFTAVYIPSQAVQLADGRIAIPESLIAMEDSADLAYRGAPSTWVRHYSVLVVLSDASGTWLIDEILPFCIGQDCDFFWEQYEETAERVLGLATPEAPMETPPATPGVLSPTDDVAWTTCPEYSGPWELASRASDSAGTPNGGPSIYGPAEPPTVPCPTPGPQPPVEFTPVPLD